MIIQKVENCLSYDEIIDFVYGHTNWFISRRSSWLNVSISVEDLQQAFLLHCFDYKVADRYDGSTKKTTYIMNLMINYIYQKYWGKHLALKRYPKYKNVISDTNEKGENILSEDLSFCNTESDIEIIEIINMLRTKLKERGDLHKLKIVNCWLKGDYEKGSVEFRLAKKTLRKIAGTVVGRAIFKEIVG